MKLVVGLGNIGDKYVFTRHNVGFMLLDSIAVNSSLVFKEDTKFKCLMTRIRINNEDYILAKPTTFMNLSGESVRAITDYYKIDVKDILIIYDDLSIELGKFRFRAKGTDGGHNGIKSIINNSIKQEIPRLKIGIGPQPNIPAEVFVLQNFSKEELELLKKTLITAKEGIATYFIEGLAKAQNVYN